MEPYEVAHYGNPSSLHARGRAARAGLDDARDRLAQILGCRAGEIIFTSGGTEADNLALIGVSEAHPHQPLWISAVEHRAVLDAAAYLRDRRGVPVHEIPVDHQGRVQVEWVLDHVTPDTALVSVMYVNNEIGTVEPIRVLGQALRERGILFHVDAVQAAEYFPLADLPCDLLSLSAHKFGGPKGAGLLRIRRDVEIVPLLHGGGQERERRPGTENVAGMVGMATALELAAEERELAAARVASLRDRLLAHLRQALPDTRVYGPLAQADAASPPETSEGAPSDTSPSILCVGWPGITGETMVVALDLAGVEVSSGAACSAGSLAPSHVLKALGLEAQEAAGGVRFSLGRETTREEVDEAARRVIETVERLRERQRRGD